MMDLKMEAYTPSLELVGMLEIQRSVIWEEKAFSAGSFSVESLITDESLDLLQPENIIWIDGETAGIIEYVQEEAGRNGPYITVKGRDLSGILDRRILWGLYDLKGTVPEIMRHLVDDCCINPTRGDTSARKIPGLVLLDAPSGGEAIRIQKTGGTLLDALEELGGTYGVAFGVRFNPAIPQMEFWTRWGQDRSIHQTANDPVFYSTELDDVLSSEYSYNSISYRNVSLVAGEGEGKDRVYVTVENEALETPDVPAPQPPAPPTPIKCTVTLSVDPSDGGTVSGGKTVASGVSVTVTAAPSDGYEFTGWSENGVVVSSSPAYTFTVTGDRNLTAVFSAIIPVYVITVGVDPSGSGTVTGAGQYKEGDIAILTATAADGFEFTKWQESEEIVSENTEYTFIVDKNRELVAIFAEEKFVLNWASSTLPVSSIWQIAAFGNGIFVSLSSALSKAAAYSTDGITWEPVTLPVSGNWYSATYGNGKFVAVGYSSEKAIYSDDGVTWKSATLPSDAYWFSVTYGNGKFVAVSQGSRNAAYSADGITWKSATLPVSDSWYSVAYGNGKFVAVANGRNAAYSTDGITWKSATLPSSVVWRVAYGNGRFVAVAQNSNKAAYSTDGITWEPVTLPVSGNWYSVTYGNGKFVAVSAGTDASIYSEDGIVWEYSTLPLEQSWRSITYGNGKFVAVANGSGTAAYALG